MFSLISHHILHSIVSPCLFQTHLKEMLSSLKNIAFTKPETPTCLVLNDFQNDLKIYVLLYPPIQMSTHTQTNKFTHEHKNSHTHIHLLAHTQGLFN